MDQLKIYRLGLLGVGFVGTLLVAALLMLRGEPVPEWFQAFVVSLGGGVIGRDFLRQPSQSDPRSRGK